MMIQVFICINMRFCMLLTICLSACMTVCLWLCVTICLSVFEYFFLCVTICFSVCDYVLCTSDLNEALYDILCNSIALFNFLSNVLH